MLPAAGSTGRAIISLRLLASEPALQSLTSLFHAHEAEPEVDHAVADEVIGAFVLEADENDVALLPHREPRFGKPACGHRAVTLHFDSKHLRAFCERGDGCGPYQPPSVDHDEVVAYTLDFAEQGGGHHDR